MDEIEEGLFVKWVNLYGEEREAHRALMAYRNRDKLADIHAVLNDPKAGWFRKFLAEVAKGDIERKIKD